MSICTAESHGFRCNRPMEHGMLHCHPDLINNDSVWWIRWPANPEEYESIHMMRWTSYLMVNDKGLDMVI